MTSILSRLFLAGAALLVAAAVAGFNAPSALARDYKLGGLSIAHPWARASAGPARNGAAFLAIENAGGADRLIAISGEVCERAELHTHMMEGEIMKMRRVQSVEVPAKGSAALQPGGFHIMLVGLKHPLQEGERFPLTLTFETAGEITVEFAVEGVGSMGPQGGTGHDTMDHGTMTPAN